VRRGEIPDQWRAVAGAELSLLDVPQGAGAAFRSRASANVEEFEWVQGESLVTFYESSPGNHRGLCRTCGSPVVSRFDGVSYYGVPLGALDDDPGVRPELHVHVASKAPWFTITDDLPQFAAGPV
jgi:hypothetical protein